MSPRRIGFLLIKDFALMSCAAAVEPLRAANLLAGRELYDLTFLSTEETTAVASVGACFDTLPLRSARADLDMLFVTAGANPMTFDHAQTIADLRRLDRHGVVLGGISGGGVILARAKLMQNRRFTVHWQHFEALRETDDTLLMERRLFVIDRDRYSCAGGTAPLDMMYAIIAADHGASLARDVSDWFIHTRVRLSGDPQRAGLVEKYNVHHPALVAAIDLMDNHVADPLTLQQLAALSDIGARQLQRLFAESLGVTAMQFYRTLRLEKADELLRQTSLPVGEVALATGFGNSAHFARVYKLNYSRSPRESRQIHD